MKLIWKLFKNIVCYILIGILCFGAWKVGNKIGDILQQLEKAERVERQLGEIYLVQAELYSHVKDLQEFVIALTEDMMVNKSDISEQKELAKTINNEINTIENNLNKSNNEFQKIVKKEIEKPSYEKLKSMTVLVINPDNNNPDKESMGTGVVVKIDKKYTYILTNQHVCDAHTETDCLLRTEEGIYTPLEPYKYTDSGYDMSLLRTRAKLKGKVAISKIVQAFPQDRVFIVGHHLGRPYIYGEGVFAGYDERDEVVQLPTMYGNSGSGVFNSKAELIGIIYAGRGASMFQMDFAHAQTVPGTVLKMFIGDLLDEK